MGKSLHGVPREFACCAASVHHDLRHFSVCLPIFLSLAWSALHSGLSACPNSHSVPSVHLHLSLCTCSSVRHVHAVSTVVTVWPCCSSILQPAPSLCLPACADHDVLCGPLSAAQCSCHCNTRAACGTGGHLCARHQAADHAPAGALF